MEKTEFEHYTEEKAIAFLKSRGYQFISGVLLL